MCKWSTNEDVFWVSRIHISKKKKLKSVECESIREFLIKEWHKYSIWEEALLISESDLDLKPSSFILLDGVSMNKFLQFFFFFFGTTFKVFIESVRMLLLLYVLVLWTQGIWDFSSLTSNRTHSPCIGRRSLNHWAGQGSSLLKFSETWIYLDQQGL